MSSVGKVLPESRWPTADPTPNPASLRQPPECWGRQLTIDRQSPIARFLTCRQASDRGSDMQPPSLAGPETATKNPQAAATAAGDSESFINPTGPLSHETI